MPHSRIHLEIDEIKRWLFFLQLFWTREKYFFKNFSTTSSQVFKLFPLNECNHLFASLDNEKENKLSLTASSGTPAIVTVLQISIYVARCAYGSSFDKP